METKLSIITDVKQVRENIVTFNLELEHNVQLQKKITSFKHWYYSETENMFGPSKFIGYGGVNGKLYEEGTKKENGISLGYMDGRDTELVLKKMSKLVEGEERELLYNKLTSFLKEFDKDPKKNVVIHKLIRG